MLSHTHLHDAEELLFVFYGLCRVISIHVCEHIGGEEIPTVHGERERDNVYEDPLLVEVKIRFPLLLTMFSGINSYQC